MKLSKLASAIALSVGISTYAAAVTVEEVQSKGAEAIIAEALQKEDASIESVMASLGTTLKDNPQLLAQVVSKAVESYPALAAQIVSATISAAPNQANAIKDAAIEAAPQLTTLINQAADDALADRSNEEPRTEIIAENPELDPTPEPEPQPEIIATPTPPPPPVVTPPTPPTPIPASPST